MAPSPPTSPSPPEAPPSPQRESSRPTLLTTVSKFFTADLDDNKFHFMHPRRIHLIQNPVDADDEDNTDGGSGGGEGAGAELAPEESREAPQPEAKAATTAVKKHGGKAHSHHFHFGPDPFELGPDDPPLRYQTESSTIQLFYDLFFVANLTTFTAKNEVSNGSSRLSDLSDVSG
jgi:hypothetical protein